MKKIFSFLALLGILLSSNCTRIAENNDPVIGIWTHISTGKDGKVQKQDITIKQEWIFNDAFLGRYHTYNNQELTVITDFKWSFMDNAYTISYPGLDREADVVNMKETENGTVLTDNEGHILAVRE